VYLSRDRSRVAAHESPPLSTPAAAPAPPAPVAPPSRPEAFNPNLKPVAAVAQPQPVAAAQAVNRPALKQPSVQTTNATAHPTLNQAPSIGLQPAQFRRKYPAIDMGLPGAEELIKKQPVIKRHKLYRLRTWLFRGTVAALVLVIAVGGLLFTQGFLKVNKTLRGGATAAALQRNVNPHMLKGEGDGRINILLLGSGGAGHDGPDLTDTMMVASIDPVNKTASLVSIPRDLWVQGNGSAMKINAVYPTAKYNYLGRIDSESKDENAIKAGISAVDQSVEDVLGISIHYNVLIDFQAFRKAIDTVGGVDVNVPEQLVDPTMAWENNRNPVLAKAGLQHFDGKNALMYVRSRHTSSDFARSERQRAVLLALKDKVVSVGTLSNPLKISELISAFGNNVYSDLSLADTVSLYKIFKGINNHHVTSLGLGDEGKSLVTTGMVGDQSTVQPLAGMFDFSEIRSYIRSQLVDGYIKKEHAKIVVLNGTDQEGLATEKGDLLKSYGYDVTKVDNAPTNSYNQTVIVDRTGGKAKYTKNYLEKRFNVKATTKLPDSAILPGDADFIIILGSNEAFSSEN
jgi:LCP family protein required for cell wall assembly